MANDFLFRRAVAFDIDSLVQITRHGFLDYLLDAIIYGCPGIGKFIELQMNTPASLADTVYWVAVSAKKVVGCAELRLLPTALFLNYIAVLPEFHSQRIATRLLKSAITSIRQSQHLDMQLDVFEHNLVARSWYERLGFTKLYVNEWWDIPIRNTATTCGQAVVSGYAQAVISHEKFGFSQFQLVTSQESYSVGRIGQKWFRINQTEALTNPIVISTLGAIDGKRHILALIPASKQPALGNEATLLARSLRMNIPLDTLVNNL